MSLRRLVEDVQSVMEWGGRGRGRGYSQDPYLTKAKVAGTDVKGLPYKKGDEIMIYKDGAIYAGANKDKEWREFQAAKDDEAFMSGGMESAEPEGPELDEAKEMSPRELIEKGDNLIKILEGAVEEMRKGVAEAQAELKGYARIGVPERAASALLKKHMLPSAERLEDMAKKVRETIEDGIKVFSKGESVIQIGPALVESSVLTKGSTNEIRKSIFNEIMKIIEMSGVYVVANISTGGRAQQVSGSVVRMINFIQDHSPPAEHVSIVDFSTDRNWARSKADEI
jgi:hypothetical protein